jgi:hypothetical protein
MHEGEQHTPKNGYERNQLVLLQQEVNALPCNDGKEDGSGAAKEGASRCIKKHHGCHPGEGMAHTCYILMPFQVSMVNQQDVLKQDVIGCKQQWFIM